jgi:hypothetical protein
MRGTGTQQWSQFSAVQEANAIARGYLNQADARMQVIDRVTGRPLAPAQVRYLLLLNDAQVAAE